MQVACILKNVPKSLLLYPLPMFMVFINIKCTNKLCGQIQHGSFYMLSGCYWVLRQEENVRAWFNGAATAGAKQLCWCSVRWCSYPKYSLYLYSGNVDISDNKYLKTQFWKEKVKKDSGLGEINTLIGHFTLIDWPYYAYCLALDCKGARFLCLAMVKCSLIKLEERGVSG